MKKATESIKFFEFSFARSQECIEPAILKDSKEKRNCKEALFFVLAVFAVTVVAVFFVFFFSDKQVYHFKNQHTLALAAYKSFSENQLYDVLRLWRKFLKPF